MHQNWYQTSIQCEAGAKDYLAALIVGLYASLPAAMPESAKAQQVAQQIQQNHNTNVAPNFIIRIVKNFQNQTNQTKQVEQPGQPGQTTNSPNQVSQAKPVPDQQKIADTIAKTLYGEAGGESEDGKRAVASVIWNRAGGSADRFVGVCTKSGPIISKKTKKPALDKNGQPIIVWQFDCWRKGVRPDYKSKTWQTCLKIANEMVSGAFSPTVQSKNYYAFSGPNAIKPPKWAEPYVQSGNYADIGNHRFLRN
jgi:hypothetical protein